MNECGHNLGLGALPPTAISPRIEDSQWLAIAEMTANLDESPGWLQANSRFILILAIVLLGGGAVSWYMPRAKEKSRRETWDLYNQFENALQEADNSSSMLTALIPVSGNKNAYPWALTKAAAWAAQRQDAESLQALQAKFSEVDASSAKVMVLENGKPVDMLTALAKRISGLGQLAELEPVMVEPTGPVVVFTLTASSGETYDVSYKLFSDHAPLATAHLLQKIEAGAFENGVVSPTPQAGFQLEGLAAEGDAPFQVERVWGCFHASGTLCTVLESGGDPGQQSPGKLQFLGADLYSQDGITTVIGKVVSGEDVLQTLADLDRSEDAPNKFAAEFKISAKLAE